MSPRQAILRFQGLLKKYGVEKVSSHPKAKGVREALWGAIFLLGLSQNTKRLYWLQNYQNEPPDIKAIGWSGDTFVLHGIEVTDYESHNTSLLSVITSKIKRLPYPENYILLCVMREHGYEKVYPDKLFSEVQALSPRFAEIWLLLDEMGNEWTYDIVRLHPTPCHIRFNVLDTVNNSKEEDYLTTHREIKSKLGPTFLSSEELPFTELN